MAKFFLTTAIDYPNSLPHVGTAFEKIGADVQARYRRFLGDDVFFLMGNDENTWKVAKRARELGQEPKAYCDKMALEFETVWCRLNLSFDDFIQTTEERHKTGVQYFLNAVKDAGFIYKKKFTGLYCDGCEAFKTPKEIVNERCPDHPTQELRDVAEENYFFALSKFKDKLLKLYERRIGPNGTDTYDLAIEPYTRRNEVVSFVEGEDLKDISISRKNQGWGIPVPWDQDQVVYVWFDALLNYLTGVGFGSEWEKFYHWWPANVHFIGKDITRFHCALFPAMIMAYNSCPGIPYHIDLPQKVFAHGFVYKREGDELKKIAKTGNFVDPVEIINKFGADAYRYYFLAKCDYGSDGEYDIDHFVEVYNADLANNLGNLVSRTANMVLRYFEGKLPDVKSDPGFGTSVHTSYKRHMDACEYKYALNILWDELREMNGYIERMKPWDLFKEDKEKCARVLKNVVNALRFVSIYLKPFLPDKAEAIYTAFTFKKPWAEIGFDHIEELVYQERDQLDYNVGVNPDALVGGKFPPLFQRYDG